MAKTVLPKKLHQEFHRCNNEGDIEGMKGLLEENNMDINGMFYKPDEDSEYNHYLFFEIFQGKNIEEKLDLFLSKEVDLSITGHNGKNALGCLYVYERDLPILEKLVKAGIDVNHRDNDGCTKLYHLVRDFGDKSEMGDDGEVKRKPEYFELALKFIDLLLKNGADPDIKNNYDTSASDWIIHRREENLADETDEQLEAFINSK